ACPSECTANDQCLEGAWECACLCPGDTDGGEADGGTVLDGGGGFDGGSTSDAGVTPSSVCLDLAKRRCDYWIRCRTEGDDPQGNPNNQGRINDSVAASERAKCEAREAADPGCVIGAEGWRQGRAMLDAAAYDACIAAAHPSATCVRDLNQAFTLCEGAPFVIPNTAVGGACADDSECIDGFCSGGALACGVCTAYQANGQPCRRDAMCNPASSFCPGPDGQNGTCTAYTAPGANCSRFSNEECGPGRVCAAQTPLGQGTCEVGRTEGQGCTLNAGQCLRGRGNPQLVCANVAGNGTCVKVFNSQPGRQCDTGEAFTGGAPFCLETEFCSANLCFPRRALGADGGTCSTLADQCVFGARCVGTGGPGFTGLCTAYADVGEACANNGACKNLLTCVGNTCQPALRLAGEPCSNNAQCAGGFCSTDGGCSPLLADGESCANGNQCQSDVCALDGGSASTCQDACWD
ncbi:MAG: hypothetical protein ACOZIN_04500, partial [Myxococcota bacterium]